VGSSPAVDSEGRVYIGGDPGIYCLNGTDGRVIWKYQTTTLIGSSPALSNDGSLLVGGEDGWLYKLVGG
jgi:outer membrane protein assembly factor BamB